MKIIHALLVVVVANLLSGALLATAFHSETTLAVALGIAALVMSSAGTFWLLIKFRTAVNSLSQSTAGSGSNPVTSTGLQELDELAQRIHNSFSSLSSQSQNETNEVNSRLRELKEVQSFLAELDRRSADRDSTHEKNTTLAQLKEILRGYCNDVEAVTQQAKSCMREISRFAGELLAGADQQFDVINKTTRHLDSLTSEVLNFGENAKTAVDKSKAAKRSAETGATEFENIVAELESIRSLVSTRERKLRVLGQHSREIGTIVDAIGTLSSRTDLLALNASIESVRAGEHGRGFAIVADEVRTLSEQSAQSVTDIASRLELIQLETQESISVASGEHEQINGLIKRLSDSVAAIQHVGDSTEKCFSNVSVIAESSNQQLELLQQVVEGLATSSEVAKANRVQAEGMKWTAKTLEQLGQQLDVSIASLGNSEVGRIISQNIDPFETEGTQPESTRSLEVSNS